MIYDGLKKEEEVKDSELKILILIGQSIATSIDAFVVGISFALLNFEIVIPIIIIGVVTFMFSLLGLYLGKFLGNKIGKYVELFGGLVLIGIGTKILVEHLFF